MDLLRPVTMLIGQIQAGMAHLNLVMIHPFRDGNGRMARCLQSLVLARGGILDPVFISIEEYLGRNTQRYYPAPVPASYALRGCHGAFLAGFKARVSFKFAGCCWWAVVGCCWRFGGISGHAPVMRRRGPRAEASHRRPPTHLPSYALVTRRKDGIGSWFSGCHTPAVRRKACRPA